jgi:hypothetical protein
MVATMPRNLDTRMRRNGFSMRSKGPIKTRETATKIGIVATAETMIEITTVGKVPDPDPGLVIKRIPKKVERGTTLLNLRAQITTADPLLTRSRTTIKVRTLIAIYATNCLY